MIEDAEKYQAQDIEKKENIIAMNELQAFINKLKNPKNVSEADKKKLQKAATKGEEFIEANKHANK